MGDTSNHPVDSRVNDATRRCSAGVDGAARGFEHVIMLTLGTGVGGGVIIDGKLLRCHRPGGHLGTSARPEGPPDICNAEA